MPFLIRWMVLDISNNNEIKKITKSCFDENKTVDRFANTTILEAILFFEVINRKPEKLVDILFHRYQVDKEANKITLDNDAALHNFNNYFLSDADKLSLHEEIPLPRAYLNPTYVEKQLLYGFLKQKYPVLWNDCPYVAESRIKKSNDMLAGYKDLVKEAYLKKV